MIAQRNYFDPDPTYCTFTALSSSQVAPPKLLGFLFRQFVRLDDAFELPHQHVVIIKSWVQLWNVSLLPHTPTRVDG